MDANPLIEAAGALREETGRLRFAGAVSHVYNPLDYAWEPHCEYLRRHGSGRKRVIFLGMNPGPFGMAQTGVPFGEVSLVRDWMGIHKPVGRPSPEHPKRPVEGFECQKSEVSGRRLWGFFAEHFGAPEAFFRDHLVLNYCPLVFMSATGANITPDKLPAAEREPLEQVCDRHLARALAAARPDWVVGVGGFAEACLARVLEDLAAETRPRLGRVLHPSPASPAANRGWAAAALRQLREQGIWE
jgi:single-strand selective monofunctional uracil DNA glycosylase